MCEADNLPKITLRATGHCFQIFAIYCSRSRQWEMQDWRKRNTSCLSDSGFVSVRLTTFLRLRWERQDIVSRSLQYIGVGQDLTSGLHWMAEMVLRPSCPRNSKYNQILRYYIHIIYVFYCMRVVYKYPYHKVCFGRMWSVVRI